MYRQLTRLGGRVCGRRTFSSSTTPTSYSSNGNETTTTLSASTRSTTPGIVRVTKSYGPKKHEAELDSSLARIIGSDWGDRSHQPVSLPMRIYWLVFVVVLGNGLYTYFAGKDEGFLVEKLKKKADEKVGGQVEETEYHEVKHQQKPSTTASSTSLLTSTAGATVGMPFFAPNLSKPSIELRPKSKGELEQQLAQLRAQKKRLYQQHGRGDAAANEELAHQVRMIDIQKDQVKRMMTNV